MGNWCGCCEPPTVSRAGDLPALSREAKNGSGKHNSDNSPSCSLPGQGSCVQELKASQYACQQIGADAVDAQRSTGVPSGAPAAPEPGPAVSVADEAADEEEEEESTSDSGPHDTEDTDDFTNSEAREEWMRTCREYRIKAKKYRRYCVNNWMYNAEKEDRDDPAPLTSAPCLAADAAQSAPNEASGSELGDGDGENNSKEPQERAAASREPDPQGAYRYGSGGAGCNSSCQKEPSEAVQSAGELTEKQLKARRTAGARVLGKKQARAEGSGKAKNAAAKGNCTKNKKTKPPGTDEAHGQHPGRSGLRSALLRERCKK